MSVRGGRPRRPDAWPDPHARARFRTAERLDGPLDPGEETWLDEHLRWCVECSGATAEYASQRLELRALAERQPVPPRDLWARTAAAIEQEASFRDRTRTRRSRRSLLAPYALVTSALAVAVVVALSSKGFFARPATPQPSGPITAAFSPAAITANPQPTPLVVPRQEVKWITKDDNGDYQVSSATIDEVCSTDAKPCATTAPSENHQVQVDGTAQTVVGSHDGQEIVVFSGNGSPQTNVSVLKLQPGPGASPNPSPSDTSVSPSPSASASSAVTTPTPTPTPTPTAPPSTTPTASPPGSPTPSASVPIASSPSPSGDGSVQIAHDVIVVGQAASYSSSGAWFAFTARPANGSTGPDIYVWRVGDPEAHPVTTDHRSELGSWSVDTIVGSTAVETPNGTAGAAFILDPATGKEMLLPQTGNAWRPSVDPFGTRAVYWTGRLDARTDGPGFTPGAGELVIGSWGTGTSAPTDGLQPTAPGNQKVDRHETTIADGPVTDWDVRWDETGTRLAVWIADKGDPTIGRLTLYAVNPLDGKVDLRKPLIDGRTAKAGFAIAKGRLIWAEPASAGASSDGRILLYAWTDKGSGEVETVPGQVTVIR
jgi:hypothetical protein